MKTVSYQFKPLILLLVMLALGIPGWAQQTRDQHPNASGLSATAQSIPGMSRAQREGLKNPEQGTLVYQTDNAAGYYVNNGTPEQPRWTPVTFGGQMPAPEAVNNGSRAPLSGERGFLPPRLTDAQMYAIANPAEGLMIYNLGIRTLCVYNGTIWDCVPSIYTIIPYPAGSVHCIPGGALVQEVTNPATGKTWMDRNLGASQAATSSADANAYGDLYQWGRFSEGHQCRTSDFYFNGPVNTPLPNLSQEWYGLFLPEGGIPPYDWLSPQVNNLWQGVTGTNNPCPQGFRLPTGAEWTTEYATWNTPDAAGAFASPLKLTVGGNRGGTVFNNVGTYGNYGSSTVNSIFFSELLFSTNSNSATVTDAIRAQGSSIRCIKD